MTLKKRFSITLPWLLLSFFFQEMRRRRTEVTVELRKVLYICLTLVKKHCVSHNKKLGIVKMYNIMLQ